MVMTRPRICQLLHGMTVGGAEVLADRLARNLSARYEMVFACLDQIGELGQQLQSDGYRVECLNRNSGVDLRCAWRFARFLRRERIDLVLAHQYTPFFYSMTGRLFGKSRPIVFVEHGRALPDYPRPKRMTFNRWMVRKEDRLIAVGKDVRRALIENEGLPADRVEVIYNGVNLEPFVADDLERTRVRAELKIDPKAFVIAQVARLDYLKDHLTAVRTMAKVVETTPNAVLLLVGEGEERQAIEAEMAKSSLQNHVRLLGLRSDIPRLLNASDAMLLTSISEGIPLTLIEGMASRLPIVSTNVGRISEVVKEEQTALLAPAGDADLLAQHLIQLARDPELGRKMGQLGYQSAHECFSEEVMHAQYERLFEEVLGIQSSPITTGKACAPV